MKSASTAHLVINRIFDLEGFKFHLIVNDQGEVLALFLTPGNIDDREPLAHMPQALFGKLFGDRGYVSQRLFEQLSAFAPRRFLCHQREAS
jgi:Transposase DDE domain